jgi:hypothetical protein
MDAPARAESPTLTVCVAREGRAVRFRFGESFSYNGFIKRFCGTVLGGRFRKPVCGKCVGIFLDEPSIAKMDSLSSRRWTLYLREDGSLLISINCSSSPGSTSEPAGDFAKMRCRAQRALNTGAKRRGGLPETPQHATWCSMVQHRAARRARRARGGPGRARFDSIRARKNISDIPCAGWGSALTLRRSPQRRRHVNPLYRLSAAPWSWTDEGATRRPRSNSTCD